MCCLSCGRIWREYVTEHTTWYAPDRACFPLCERCWQRLGTAEARLPFYRVLIVEDWKQPELWPDVEAAVRAEAVAA